MSTPTPKSSLSSELLQDKSVQTALKEMLREYPVYAQKLLKIRTKEGEGLEPLRLNTIQQNLVHEVAERQLKEKGRVRMIILKARRMGITTYVQGRFFHKAVTKPGIVGVTVTHVRDSTSKIFQMNRLFYEQLPDLFKPQTKYSSKLELVFRDPLNSALYLDTAGESTARGGTVNYFHASEVAYWKDAEKSFLSVMQAASNAREIYIESTANGNTGYFKELYSRAKRGEGDFEAVFLPWFAMEEYQMPPEKGFTPTAREMRLVNRYKLTDAQLQWRRWAIENLCQGSEDLFHQEYPSNDDEAFLLSGRQAIPRGDMEKLENNTRRPLVNGVMEWLAEGNVNSAPEFKPMRGGWIKLYKAPDPNRTYVIGADVGGVADGTDYHAATVIDHLTGEQMAELHGHMDIDVYAEQLDLLGRWYNSALLSVERNAGPMNYGPAICTKLAEVHEYPNLYHEQTYDTETQKYTVRVGWNTNARTRPMIISEVQKLARDCEPHEGIFKSAELVAEMRTLVYNERGRIEAAEGEHDDCIMAFGQAHVLRNQVPASSISQEVYQIPITF